MLQRFQPTRRAYLTTASLAMLLAMGGCGGGGGGGGGGYDNEEQHGTACRWNGRGFGFIKPDDGGEELFCAKEFRRFRQHASAALRHQQVASVTDGRIGGNTGPSIRPAALQRDHEF